MNIKNIRMQFPTLRQEEAPAYLDNACVTLKPDGVVKAINDYYTKTPGCGGRSVHRYGTAVSRATSDARIKLQKFLNAEAADQVVFTRNATH